LPPRRQGAADPKDWARRIHERLQAGDKTLRPYAIAAARAALRKEMAA